MMRDRKKLATVLIALNLAFIWGNSLRIGNDSREMSEGLLEWINFFLRLEDVDLMALLHHLLRKAAHITEFACLGALLTWRSRMDEQKHTFAFPALLGMAAGLVDETIQLYTPNRGPSLFDVWLDSFGVVVGILLLILGQHLLKRKHNP